MLIQKTVIGDTSNELQEIVITFYLPSCLGQQTAKGRFGFRVNLPPAHLSTTHGGGFTPEL